MKKFLFTLTMAAALSGMQANAESKLYSENVTVNQGETTLELKLMNDAKVAGYQANLSVTGSNVTIGEGIAMTSNKMPGSEPFVGAHNMSATSLNMLVYSNECLAYSASATGKAVLTVPVNFTAAGTYTFTLSGVILSDEVGTTTKCSDVTFTVTVNAGVPNDVNGDKIFDFEDAQDLFAALMGMSTKDVNLVDYNKDGVIDFEDPQNMFEVLMGLKTYEQILKNK